VEKPLIRFKEFIKVDEALDMSQRRARARSLKKNKAKIAMGRRRAARKTANPEKLEKRARRQAIGQMFTRLSKGKSKEEVPFTRRQEIEKRIEKMKPKIDRITKKLLPKVRKMERERKRGAGKSEQ